MSTKKHSTNAARQRAYRHRNRNGGSPAIAGVAPVTVATPPLGRDTCEGDESIAWYRSIGYLVRRTGCRCTLCLAYPVPE
jgi:hypothetical protein